jgi:hypothetical protein
MTESSTPEPRALRGSPPDDHNQKRRRLASPEIACRWAFGVLPGGFSLHRRRAYSIMLYMKTRVTFRVASDLADKLRELPNQTQFVEAALRNALGIACPTCAGSGRVFGGSPKLPNFRKASLPNLDRETALQLQSVVRLARRLAATDVALAKSDVSEGLRFSVLRGRDVLLEGNVTRDTTQFAVH